LSVAGKGDREEEMGVALEDLRVYRVAYELSQIVWGIAVKWDIFAKKTIGSQFVDAIDSVSANIAEGYGRFHKKDKIKFYYNARGSLYESMDWLNKAHDRKLITEDEYSAISKLMSDLPHELNGLIKSTGINLKI
jgi:four helix bundle protein